MIGPIPLETINNSMNNNNNNNDVGGGEVLAPWDPMNAMNPNNLDPVQAAAWRERERRQRTIRLLMMFLLMLLLMDSEEQSGRKRSEPRHKRNHPRSHLSEQVFGTRKAQELRLQELTKDHPRYNALVEKNQGKNVHQEVLHWAEQQAEVVKDEFVATNAKAEPQEERRVDPEENSKVFHYPWNATGFYRGEWIREDEGKATETMDGEEGSGGAESPPEKAKESSKFVDSSGYEFEGNEDESGESFEVPATQYVDALTLETEMRQIMRDRKERLGVVLLPPGKEVILRYDHSNFTSFDWKGYSSVPPKGAEHYYMRAGKADSSASKTSGADTVDSDNNKDENGDASTIGSTVSNNPSMAHSKVTLTKPSGRAAFQLFSRSIPTMQEISLVDGFLKLYDSNMPGYSTHKDILLRVRGVLIHAIGRMSLVSNAGPGRTVLVLGENQDGHIGVTDSNEDENDDTPLEQRKRRLQEAVVKLKLSPNDESLQLNQIRDDVIAVYGSEKAREKDGQHPKEKVQFKFETVREPSDNRKAAHSEPKRDDAEMGIDMNTITLEEKPEGASSDVDPDTIHTTIIRERRTKAVEASPELETSNAQKQKHQRLAKPVEKPKTKKIAGSSATSVENEVETASPGKYTWSDVVIPYPFVLDDEDETLRKTKTPAARKMPPREQLLERNAGICEFEVTMDTKEVEWTLGEWRKLVGRRVKESMDLNPANQPLEGENEDSVEEEARNERKGHRIPYGSTSGKSSKSSRERHNRKPIQDQALVMTMTGSIHSPNCDFTASLNVTALRTDWEHTTGKAINYSFYMMLTCLTQIMVLLRQLLHTQAQSAATRVSLLCIGWQTVLDALLCLGHIYLSLAMQPLFTAFASVAFFKLLIFCVIEMKYMALIIQARNASNGGNTTELLRRQVAMLHLRFYVALFGAFLAFFYAGERFRIPYNLVLYSFWVPQIVQNVITEAKRPMHNYYIYGMSITRLVAPLYIFAVPNNFLKEVYPESPTDLFMCECLVLWVGIQTAVLIAQGKYGARFMIPARFLPPKFDYSRPIPPSLLPPGTSQDMPPEPLPLRQGRGSGTGASTSLPETQSLLPSEPVIPDRHTTSDTTRNRIKGGRRTGSTMTTETVVQVDEINSSSSGHTLDCVICYNAIDVHNRRGYMLAPCDHIFHKDCLVQWMDVKMECPICRTELPSL